MRRPKHTTAKARTKSAAGRICARHWLKGPGGQAVFRSMMDRVLERTVAAVYGVNVTVENGRMTRAKFANGETHELA